jgi:hypothetical protein
MSEPSHPRLARLLRFFATAAGWASLWLICCAALFAQQPDAASADSAIAALHQGFANPPDNCKIMMRWWWFGPSATHEELRKELEQMNASGVGGVEIATLYPLALDNPETGFSNYSFLSDKHLDNLRFAADEARRLHMRVDVTLGSGWPLGGPRIPVTQAAGALRVQAVAVPAGTESIAVPPLEAGEHR